MTRKVRLKDVRPGPIRREPDPAWRPYIEEIRDSVGEFYDRTVEEWEEGFCRDLTPEREIAIWLSMAARYRRALARREFNKAERKEIFGLVVEFGNNGRPSEMLARLSVLSREEGESILRGIGEPLPESEA